MYSEQPARDESIEEAQCGFTDTESITRFPWEADQKMARKYFTTNISATLQKTVLRRRTALLQLYSGETAPWLGEGTVHKEGSENYCGNKGLWILGQNDTDFNEQLKNKH